MTEVVEECLAILTRTPATLDSLLRGLPEVWTRATEGPDTWSPRIVMGHLIHCEKVDWMRRLKIILESGTLRKLDPVDREADTGQDRTVEDLLDEFRAAREENLLALRALHLRPEQLALQGMHPALGVVTARQLLATWTAHDLAHILQISRVMAKRLKPEVGPWAEYLSVMK
ncbi:MAG: DinB family protein [Acidobacteriota bacterium]